MYATDDAFTLMLSCSWCDGAIGRATDLQLTGRGFWVLAGHHYKLLTPVCLCHQAV